MVGSLFSQRCPATAAAARSLKVALAAAVLLGMAPPVSADSCELRAEAVTDALLNAQVIRSGSEDTAGDVVTAALCEVEAAAKPERKANNKVLGVELENAEPGSKGHERLKRKR